MLKYIFVKIKTYCTKSKSIYKQFLFKLYLDFTLNNKNPYLTCTACIKKQNKHAKIYF